MTVRTFVDSNILIYAHDADAGFRQRRALEELAELDWIGRRRAAPWRWGHCFRLRVGYYRVVFRRIDNGLEVLAVGHRSDVYR